MALLILAYVGGALTILSPCILPVLPFVLARADRPFFKRGLPVLMGLALAFAATASLTAVASGWAVQANLFGRFAAYVVLGLLGLTLMLPRLAARFAQPFVTMGVRLNAVATGTSHGAGAFVSSLVTGMAAGLLWSPCAGPILGLVLAGAATQGDSLGTYPMLLAYAAGAASALALALLATGRVVAWLKRALGVGQWARRGMGLAVLAAVALLATGQSNGLASLLTPNNAADLEAPLVAAWAPQAARPLPTLEPSAFDGGLGWINAAPLTGPDLHGKVMVVEFWTYSCINCLRTLPYLRAWAEKYKNAGLVVVGVHSPEFAFERNAEDVRRAVKDLHIGYPVVLDSAHAIWHAWHNQAWPALYFVDAKGTVRHQIIGEGQYAQAEQLIQQLLRENGQLVPDGALAEPRGDGVQAAPGQRVLSGESYLGYAKAETFGAANRDLQRDQLHIYTSAPAPRLNQWALKGPWTVAAERAEAARAGARLALRFNARDLHLVLGREDRVGPPLRFRIRVDGREPDAAHGTDVSADGIGVIDAHRLYQLVRLPSSAEEHLFEIEFLDPGAHVYAFTFG